MKRFDFRLGAALHWREIQAESEQAKLQQLLSEKLQITMALEALGAERLEAKTRLCLNAELAGIELRIVSSFLIGIDAHAANLRKGLQEIAPSIENQRQRVIKAERNVRLLIKLRDRKLQDWKHDVSREIETVAQESWLATRHSQRRSIVNASNSNLPRLSPASSVQPEVFYPSKI